MSFPRFFVEDLALDEASAADVELLLEGDNAHHARTVLRMQPGEQAVLTKGDGRDYYCEVLGSETDGLRLRYLQFEDNRSESLPQIILWQGLPKASKFEEIIEKSVELGAHRIVPLKTQRSLIKLDDKSATAKQSRWQKISASAAKQSGRGLIPAIALPYNFDLALAEIASDLCPDGGAGELFEISSDLKKANAMAFIAWEEALEPTLPSYINRILNLLPDLERMHILIGPEGGFASSEVEAAMACGITALSLGPRILRTETAGPAVLAMLNVLLPGKM